MPDSQTYQQCRAVHPDYQFRCEDEEGHRGDHWVTSRYTWERDVDASEDSHAG